MDYLVPTEIKVEDSMEKLLKLPSDRSSSSLRTIHRVVLPDRMPTWAKVVLCCCLLAYGFVGWAQYRFGSYRFALEYIRGARLQVVRETIPVGEHHPGEVFSTQILIRNHDSAPVSIVGARANCSCVARRGLPTIILPGQVGVLPVTIYFGDKIGPFNEPIEYLTNRPAEAIHRIKLVGQVVDR